MNHRSADESDDAFVPPFAIPRTPVTSVVSETKVFVMAPAVARRMPVTLPKVSPPPVMLMPPAKVLVAVLVASMVPVWSLSTWNPDESDVEVAVVVEMERCSKTEVEDAMREYFAFVTGR